jgi:citrate lyase beta subunit
MTTFTFAESAFVPLAVGFFGLVAAAATSGIASIDVPYFKGDEAGPKREAAASRKLGMTGKAAFHAEQLDTINNIFSPSPESVTHARAVIAAAKASGNGTPVLNGHVIEPAMLREAERGSRSPPGWPIPQQ